MRSLRDIMEFVSKDTILEKLKIDDIKIAKEFPTSGNVDDIVSFLTSNGFKEEKINMNMDIVGQFNNLKAKGYIITYSFIWWADTTNSDISPKNPAFGYFIDANRYLYVNKRFEKSIFIKLQDFIKKLNKRFGWK